MKWIICLAVLVMAIIIFRIVKKRRKIKKEKIAKKKRRETIEKRAVDNFYGLLSVTKETLSDEELAKIAPFELRYTEEAFYMYHRVKEMLTKRTTIEIIQVFLWDKNNIKKMVSSDVALKEIDAFSDLFMRKMIEVAKEENKEKSISNFWWTFILEIYCYTCSNLYDKNDFELYGEYIASDVKKASDFKYVLTNIERLQTMEVVAWCDKLKKSEHYKNLVQEELKLEQEKAHADFQDKLQTFKARGIIDKEFISYIRTRSEENERVLIREVFDEIILSETLKKFFPEKDRSQIQPELLAILSQTYASVTLKLIG